MAPLVAVGALALEELRVEEAREMERTNLLVLWEAALVLDQQEMEEKMEKF
jgi:hypothetical protein